MTEQPPQSNEPPVLKLLLGLGVVIVVMILVVIIVINTRNSAPTANNNDNGTLALVDENAFSSGVNAVEPHLIADVALIDMNGLSAQFSDLRGKYTVLYFGYTFCPDFCPATLTDFRLIARELGEQAANVNFVLISVDPQRDTPEILKGYVTRFNPDFLAYTGESAALTALTAEFGAFFQSMAGDGSNPYYTVNHTASSFVLNPDGEWVTVYAFGTSVDAIVADLRQKLK